MPPKRSMLTLRVGDTFADRYVVEARLGAGGMGAVYRVRDTFVGETIALKLAVADRAHPGRAAVLWELQRSEVAMARRVTHPHVARVFDLGRADGTPYITMAYVPGRTLRRALEDESLTMLDLVRIGHDVSSALTAAHAAGVLHLDLKPENIVLTGDTTPTAVLVDFGIARALGAAGSAMGTADYISPEQLERQTLTGAADVFALGCVLSEALGGRRTFPGRTRQERMMARLVHDPQPLPATVPDALAALVRRCLARSAAERPTAAFLERAFVEQLIALDPTAVPTPTASNPPSTHRADLGAFAGGLGRRVATARRQLLRLGREPEALAELDAILAVEPNLDVALALRALALVRLWHRTSARNDDEGHALAERAAEAVAAALAGAAHLADTHLADALIADYSGDLAYAVRALRRAHASEPLHAFAHEVLGRIELEATVGGVDRLLLAHELDPGQLGALVAVAREYFFTGRDDAAEELLAVVETQQRHRNLEVHALRLRLCLWRKDRALARRLLSVEIPSDITAVQVLVDGAAALVGDLAVGELIERAGVAAGRTTSPKRRSHVHQCAVESLAGVAPDEAVRHLVSAARQPLADLRWLDACPSLRPLRGTLAFLEAGTVVRQRVDRAFVDADLLHVPVRSRGDDGFSLFSATAVDGSDTAPTPSGSSSSSLPAAATRPTPVRRVDEAPTRIQRAKRPSPTRH